MSQITDILFKAQSLARMIHPFIEGLVRTAAHLSKIARDLLLGFHLSDQTRSLLALMRDLHSASILRIEGLRLLSRRQLRSNVRREDVVRTPEPFPPNDLRTMQESFATPQEDLQGSLGAVEAIVDTVFRSTPRVLVPEPSYTSRATELKQRLTPEHAGTPKPLLSIDETLRRPAFRGNPAETWYQNQVELGIQPRISLDEAQQLYREFYSEYVSPGRVSPEIFSEAFLELPSNLQFAEVKVNFRNRLESEPTPSSLQAELSEQNISEPSSAAALFLPTYAAAFLSSRGYQTLPNLLSGPLFRTSYLTMEQTPVQGFPARQARESSEQRFAVYEVTQEERSGMGAVERWYQRQEAMGVRPVMNYEEARQLYREFSREYVESGEMSSDSLGRLFLGLSNTTNLEEARAELLAEITAARPTLSLKVGHSERTAGQGPPISPFLLPSYVAAASRRSSLSTQAALSSAATYQQIHIPLRDATPTIGGQTPASPTTDSSKTMLTTALPPSEPFSGEMAPTLAADESFPREGEAEWICKEEAAQVLGIQSSTIQRWIDEGRVRTRVVRSTAWVLLRDLRATVREQLVAGAETGLGSSEHRITTPTSAAPSTGHDDILQRVRGTPAKQRYSVVETLHSELSQPPQAQRMQGRIDLSRKHSPVLPIAGLGTPSRKAETPPEASSLSSISRASQTELETVARIREAQRERDVFRPTPLYVTPPLKSTIPQFPIQEGIPPLILPSDSQTPEGITSALQKTARPETNLTTFPEASETQAPPRSSEGEAQEQLRRLGRRVAEQARRYLGSG